MKNETADFLAQYPPSVRDLALELRQMILMRIPGALETVDRASRVVAYGFGTGYKDMICTIIPSKTGVKLGIVRGTELPDPHGLLEGAGKVHRHVALTKPSDLRRPGLKPLLSAAVRAWTDRSAKEKGRA